MVHKYTCNCGEKLMEETRNWKSDYAKHSQRIKVIFDVVDMFPGNAGIKTSSSILGTCLR